uniref:Uncharacterized protein n=1 Tax=Faecalibaculum rodentium TaxID=1702221 RepID=A0A140DXR6_9FIRM|nr:hypothetical protein AALO17_23090 [Faecalibaculum rodentium]
MERVQAFREKIACFREIYREKSHENLRIHRKTGCFGKKKRRILCSEGNH